MSAEVPCPRCRYPVTGLKCKNCGFEIDLKEVERILKEVLKPVKKKTVN